MQMTKGKKSAAVLGLFVQEVLKDGFYQVLAYPVSVGPSEGELADMDRGYALSKDVTSETIRHCRSDYGSTQNGLRLADLEVYSQGNNETSSGEPRRLYAFEVQYKAYSVDLRTAAGMFKTLTAIEKRTEKMEAEYGRPGSYGLYLLRVAKAIGATVMIVARKPPAYGQGFAGERPIVRSLSDGAAAVDNDIAMWVEDGKTRHMRVAEQGQRVAC
jgi:hypothetical protein